MGVLRGLGRALFGKSPAIGEVWIFDDWGNPFKKSHQVEVLDVRGGWVRYKFIGSTLFNDEAMKADSFRFCYKRA